MVILYVILYLFLRCFYCYIYIYTYIALLYTTQGISSVLVTTSMCSLRSLRTCRLGQKRMQFLMGFNIFCVASQPGGWALGWVVLCGGWWVVVGLFLFLMALRERVNQYLHVKGRPHTRQHDSATLVSRARVKAARVRCLECSGVQLFSYGDQPAAVCGRERDLPR